MAELERSEAQAAAKLAAPRILDAGPDRSSRWTGVNDKFFETIGEYGTSDERTDSNRAARDAGDGDRRRQRDHSWPMEALIGPVEMLSLALHPRSNWQVEVSGTKDDRRWIEAAIELVRAERPYVTGRGGPGL